MKRNRYMRHTLIASVCVLILMLLAGYITNHTVNVYMNNVNSANKTCIIIDAGHGGVDGGAVSCTGVYESHINLEIALKLNDFLHLLGMRTIMIRTSDISVYTQGETIAQKKISDLKQRAKIINETKNAMLVSIHQNYFTDARYSGPQVFYRGEDQNLAKQVQEALVHTLKPSNVRKVKKANGVYLMQHTQCPAILIECGFLSNREEEMLLRNSDYQKKVAATIAAAISCYTHNHAIT